ncbi:MAG: hypothetical protein GTO24_16950 [candidate division Zixibacteria bacterium]|nr:hypothetical protein [candidate division Zixibacteria bacterium]
MTSKERLYATIRGEPHDRVPVTPTFMAWAAVKLHICGNTRHLMAHVATSGADIIDVDWMVTLAEARQAVGPDVVLCGNFDPVAVLLQSTTEDVAEVARQCSAFGGQGFILMLGCEVPPGTAEENIRAFCHCDGSLISDALKR